VTIDEARERTATKLLRASLDNSYDPVIEIGTPICQNIEEARMQVTRLRGEIIRLTRENGLRIAAAGTHPISHWATVPITQAARYDQIVYDLQMVARANLIFGLHVHVAVEDHETRIQIMNAARYFLPHVFALSVTTDLIPTAYVVQDYNYRKPLLDLAAYHTVESGAGGGIVEYGSHVKTTKSQ